MVNTRYSSQSSSPLRSLPPTRRPVKPRNTTPNKHSTPEPLESVEEAGESISRSQSPAHMDESRSQSSIVAESRSTSPPIGRRTRSMSLEPPPPLTNATASATGRSRKKPAKKPAKKAAASRASKGSAASKGSKASQARSQKRPAPHQIAGHLSDVDEEISVEPTPKRVRPNPSAARKVVTPRNNASPTYDSPSTQLLLQASQVSPTSSPRLKRGRPGSPTRAGSNGDVYSSDEAGEKRPAKRNKPDNHTSPTAPRARTSPFQPPRRASIPTSASRIAHLPFFANIPKAIFGTLSKSASPAKSSLKPSAFNSEETQLNVPGEASTETENGQGSLEHGIGSTSQELVLANGETNLYSSELADSRQAEASHIAAQIGAPDGNNSFRLPPISSGQTVAEEFGLYGSSSDENPDDVVAAIQKEKRERRRIHGRTLRSKTRDVPEELEEDGYESITEVDGYTMADLKVLKKQIHAATRRYQAELSHDVRNGPLPDSPQNGLRKHLNSEKRRRASKSGPSTSISGPNCKLIIPATFREHRMVLMRTDIIDSTRALALYAERYPTHKVPSADEMTAFLETLNKQELVGVASSAHSTGSQRTIEPSSSASQPHEAYSAHELVESNSFSDHNVGTESTENTPPPAADSEVVQEIPIPKTPAGEPASLIPQSRGWVSAVKSLVTTPFRIFGARGQQVAGTPATNPNVNVDFSYRRTEPPARLAADRDMFGNAIDKNRKRTVIGHPSSAVKFDTERRLRASRSPTKLPIERRGVVSRAQVERVHAERDRLAAARGEKRREQIANSDEDDTNDRASSQVPIGSKRKRREVRTPPRDPHSGTFRCPSPGSSDDSSSEEEDEPEPKQFRHRLRDMSPTTQIRSAVKGTRAATGGPRPISSNHREAPESTSFAKSSRQRSTRDPQSSDFESPSKHPETYRKGSAAETAFAAQEQSIREANECQSPSRNPFAAPPSAAMQSLSHLNPFALTGVETAEATRAAFEISSPTRSTMHEPSMDTFTFSNPQVTSATSDRPGPFNRNPFTSQLPGDNIFVRNAAAEAANSNLSQPGGSNGTLRSSTKVFRAPSDSGSDSDEGVEENHGGDQDRQGGSTLETSSQHPPSALAEKTWEQSPPPKPRPVNAQLPQPPTPAPVVAAKAIATKYQPRNPSNLRNVTQMSPQHPDIVVAGQENSERMHSPPLIAIPLSAGKMAGMTDEMAYLSKLEATMGWIS